MGQKIVWNPKTGHQHIVSEGQAANMVRYGEWEYKPAPKKPKAGASSKPAESKPEPKAKEPAKTAKTNEGVELFDDGEPITAQRDYDAMEYAALKSLAARRGIGGTGTTDELIAKHLAYDMDASAE